MRNSGTNAVTESEKPDGVSNNFEPIPSENVPSFFAIYNSCTWQPYVKLSVCLFGDRWPRIGRSYRIVFWAVNRPYPVLQTSVTELFFNSYFEGCQMKKIDF